MVPREEQIPNPQDAKALTSYIVHKYYCENDVEAVIAQFDDNMLWFGTGDQEYAAGTETVSGIFRQFAGMVPKCIISDEHYDVLSVTPDVFLCTGRMWIFTDPSTQISLRVHQRITTVFRLVNGRLRCCHIHISNPYDDMVEGDVGFPTKLANQTYQYLQEQIESQKKQLAAQTLMLQRLSFEDALTGLFNRNKFVQIFNVPLDPQIKQLGVACFDLNGLKEMNDQFGHSAGDALICRAADQIQHVFGDKVYRTGGDEFVVIDETRDQASFTAAVHTVQAAMKECGVSCSTGMSWRCEQCSLKEQFDEADLLMYQEKRRFYSLQENNRRGRRIE